MSKGEEGSILALVAVLATGLMIMTGLAADVGMMVYQRNRLQIAADAAALAGARALTSGANEAIKQAKVMALENGVSIQNKDVEVQGGGTMVKVSLQTSVGLMTGPLVKLTNLDVGARATAAMQSKVLSRGVRPLGVPYDPANPDPNFSVVGSNFVLKLDPTPQNGNFQAIDIDGTGVPPYQNALLNGANKGVTLGETLPTETGGMTGPTKDAVNQLIGQDASSFDQVLANPSESPRVVTVVLLDQASYVTFNGKSQAKVVGFAQFYLVSVNGGGQITGKLIKRYDNLSDIPGTKIVYSARLIQ